ncbi:hypothetical protein [Vibrio navarrensis]|uniref:hypothetical protein n=1 Tax=Vibrio navarrensis TaxID=29495 RepID=UPI00051CD600|nr:hypothetical protein [Vibrio navarrensis]KGK16952.1 hypothetical protein EA25_14750 [Vibrio navarrensis]MBE4601624.1 hypothetical protein [Vibrio navarrensis]MBE4609360.1 hypothetical protein [Vibrio navarrensis]MBE4612932.1 hypothetical protein [Vibrio navarrensis]
MQQGMLSSLLLTTSLLFGPVLVSAQEMQTETAQQWLQDQQVHSKVAELLEYVARDQTNELKFALERLALPQQEVVRFLLLDKLEKQDVILTPRMAIFVESQIKMIPSYQVVEKGDGYEFTVPAFNYPAVANRLLKRWKQDQTTLDFILAAERGELQLQNWLAGPQSLVQMREALLIRELDSLSPEALDGLVKQLTATPLTTWLPPSPVVVRLAQVSEEAEMYNLLWRMKADHVSQNELERLASVGDDFSWRQIMSSTQNPSLKAQAITLLTKANPLTAEVKQFLITRMALPDDAPLVARELAKQGHSSWLEEVIAGNNRVKRGLILQALQ